MQLFELREVRAVGFASFFVRVYHRCLAAFSQ